MIIFTFYIWNVLLSNNDLSHSIFFLIISDDWNCERICGNEGMSENLWEPLSYVDEANTCWTCFYKDLHSTINVFSSFEHWPFFEYWNILNDIKIVLVWLINLAIRNSRIHGKNWARASECSEKSSKNSFSFIIVCWNNLFDEL